MINIDYVLELLAYNNFKTPVSGNGLNVNADFLNMVLEQLNIESKAVDQTIENNGHGSNIFVCMSYQILTLEKRIRELEQSIGTQK